MPTKLENLQFVQAMLREIRHRTHADGEDLLTYLIDMAYLEACDRVRQQAVAPGFRSIDGTGAH